MDRRSPLVTGSLVTSEKKRARSSQFGDERFAESLAELVGVERAAVRSSRAGGSEDERRGSCHGEARSASPKRGVLVEFSSLIVAASSSPRAIPGSSMVIEHRRDGVTHHRSEENWGLSLSLAGSEPGFLHGERPSKQREGMELVHGICSLERREAELVDDEQSLEREGEMELVRDDQQKKIFLLESRMELIEGVSEQRLRDSSEVELVDPSLAVPSGKEKQIVDVVDDGLDLDEQGLCFLLDKELVDGHGLQPPGVMEFGSEYVSEQRDESKLGREIELVAETMLSDFQLLKEHGGDERRPGSFLTVADSLAANSLSLVVSTGLVREETIQSFGDLSMKDRFAAATRDFVERENVAKDSSSSLPGELSMREKLASASNNAFEKGGGVAKSPSSSCSSSSSSSDSSSGETGSESSSSEDEAEAVGDSVRKDSVAIKTFHDGNANKVVAETEVERVVEDENDGAGDRDAQEGACGGDDSDGYDDLLVIDASAGDTSALTPSSIRNLVGALVLAAEYGVHASLYFFEEMVKITPGETPGTFYISMKTDRHTVGVPFASGFKECVAYFESIVFRIGSWLTGHGFVVAFRLLLQVRSRMDLSEFPCLSDCFAGGGSNAGLAEPGLDTTGAVPATGVSGVVAGSEPSGERRREGGGSSSGKAIAAVSGKKIDRQAVSAGKGNDFKKRPADVCLSKEVSSSKLRRVTKEAALVDGALTISAEQEKVLFQPFQCAFGGRASDCASLFEKFRMEDEEEDDQCDVSERSDWYQKHARAMVTSEKFVNLLVNSQAAELRFVKAELEKANAKLAAAKDGSDRSGEVMTWLTRHNDVLATCNSRAEKMRSFVEDQIVVRQSKYGVNQIMGVLEAVRVWKNEGITIPESKVKHLERDLVVRLEAASLVIPVKMEDKDLAMIPSFDFSVPLDPVPPSLTKGLEDAVSARVAKEEARRHEDAARRRPSERGGGARLAVGREGAARLCFLCFRDLADVDLFVGVVAMFLHA
ncbi:hypothetical protein Bca101_083022 [Brassica carinata]